MNEPLRKTLEDHLDLDNLDTSDPGILAIETARRELDKIPRTPELDRVYSALEAAKEHYVTRVRESTTDKLTGLGNRRCYEELAPEWIKNTSRLYEISDKSIGGTLLIIDANQFKTVNDTYGHAFGDITLQLIAEGLEHVARPSDISFRGKALRTGGDEYTALLVGTKDAEAAARSFQGRLNAYVAKKIESEHPDIYARNPELFTNITSVGHAAYGLDGTDLKTLTEKADARMYKMKAEMKAGR